MRYLLLMIILVLSPAALAHGSSHPTHCTYETSGYDLISHCQKDSRKWVDVSKDYYTPANIEKRKIEAVARAEEARKARPYFIALFIVLGSLIMLGLSYIAHDLSKPI